MWLVVRGWLLVRMCVLALARLALKNARGAPVNADVDPDAKRTAVEVLPMPPWFQGLIKKKGNRLTVIRIHVKP